MTILLYCLLYIAEIVMCAWFTYDAIHHFKKGEYFMFGLNFALAVSTIAAIIRLRFM